MKNSFLTLNQGLCVILLVSALAGFQACSSDGKKESRTEDAIEKTGDAVSADAKDAQADAKEKIREADEKLTEKSKEAAVDFRHDRDVVIANLKARTRELDAKIDELQAKATRNGKETKADTKDQLDKLKGERQDLKVDLEKARSATADAWQDVKKDLNVPVANLATLFDKAGDKLKRD